MNMTLKNVPDHIYQALKQAAVEQGRSLNAQIVQLLAEEAQELERRRRMRESRAELEKFVASLPRTGSSAKLIREDRER